MRKSRRPIVIASRRSPLAKAQAYAVGRALGRLHPQVPVEYHWIESEGDQRADEVLAASGGKGLFAKAVERKLLNHEADLAVHSFKDLPTQLTAGLAIAAVPRRGDARDCLVAPEATRIEELPHGAVIGTASPRRQAQLLRLRPDLKTQLLRGNVQTRLRKVFELHHVDATVMAVAGLQRAGLSEHARHPIDVETMLPSVAQGALAVQCRTDDHMSMTRCLPLNDPAAAAGVYFERDVVDRLEGDCHSPIGVLAQPVAGDARRFELFARVLSPDGSRCVEARDRASARRLSAAARKMVESLKAQGAMELLNAPPPRHAAAG